MLDLQIGGRYSKICTRPANVHFLNNILKIVVRWPILQIILKHFQIIMENFLDMVAGGQMSQIITKMEQSPPATTLPRLPTHSRIKSKKVQIRKFLTIFLKAG